MRLYKIDEGDGAFAYSTSRSRIDVVFYTRHIDESSCHPHEVTLCRSSYTQAWQAWKALIVETLGFSWDELMTSCRILGVAGLPESWITVAEGAMRRAGYEIVNI